MSDLFISEILILLLLLPVLLRPFFRRLQRIEGIALLPLLAILSCLAVIAGLGLRVSFLPVLLFTSLVFISSLPRLFKLFFHLPTDWYSPLSVLYTVILVVLFIVVVCVSWIFAPEPSYTGKALVQRKVFMQSVSRGVQAKFVVLTPVNSSSSGTNRSVVILSGDISSRTGNRDTTAWILAENGYIVVEADFSAKNDFKTPLFRLPVFRHFITLVGKIKTGSNILTDEAELSSFHEKELSRLIQFVHKEYGPSTTLFVISEGSSCNALVTKMNENPDGISGAVCIASQDFSLLQSSSAGSVTVKIDSGMMPSNAGSVPILLLTGDSQFLYGYGELASDDVLAAILCGGKRDSGRKQAELTGRRILTWLSMRMLYESN